MESANEHSIVQDDFHISCASCIEDRLSKDGISISNKLSWGRQGLLCLSNELEKKRRILGSILTVLECPLEIRKWEVWELPSWRSWLEISLLSYFFVWDGNHKL